MIEFTKQQKEVIKFMLAGMPNKKIAESLGVTQSCVSSMVGRIIHRVKLQGVQMYEDPRNVRKRLVAELAVMPEVRALCPESAKAVSMENVITAHQNNVLQLGLAKGATVRTEKLRVRKLKIDSKVLPLSLEQSVRLLQILETHEACGPDCLCFQIVAELGLVSQYIPERGEAS